MYPVGYTLITSLTSLTHPYIDHSYVQEDDPTLLAPADHHGVSGVAQVPLYLPLPDTSSEEKLRPDILGDWHVRQLLYTGRYLNIV